MVELRVMICDKTGKTYKKVLPDQSDLIGKKIGDKISGDFVGMKGFELEITGGSDASGFPMRRDFIGTGKRKFLVSKGFAAKNLKRDGEQIRRTVRGNTVNEETAQVNVKVLSGKGNVADALGIKKEDPKVEEKPKEEKPVEATKVEKKAEVKEEAPKVEEKPKEEKPTSVEA